MIIHKRNHIAACRHILFCIPPYHYVWIYAITLCYVFTSCDVADDRDLCCDRVVMNYLYISDGEDVFRQNISSLRYFLFDGNECFLRELPSEANLQYQYLKKLEAGRYTIVAIGNVSEVTRLVVPEKGSSLQDFNSGLSGGGDINADPLYYGIRFFTVAAGEVEREQFFITHMANVHCKLRVTVRWKNLPPVMSSEPCYRVALSGCAASYELDNRQGYPLGEKNIPYTPAWDREYYRDCALENLELKAGFVTLRYTDEHIPVLNILCKQENGYEAVTPEIDLKKAFAAWGYRPSTVERQEYKIIVTVYLDGHVGVKLESEVGVMDWVNGGSFG